MHTRTDRAKADEAPASVKARDASRGTLVGALRTAGSRSGSGRSGGRRWAAALALAVTAAVLAPISGAAAAEEASFGDVSVDSVHGPSVDALGSEGVLEGTECAPGQFCPWEGLARWVMAVWLVRALDGTDPDTAASTRFGDVDPQAWWATHVERLAELGVTTGCSTEPLQYCPNETVTRAQMASFLVRAFNYDEAAAAGFADVTEDGVHTANINALAAAGVTTGCSTDPPQYCPQEPVARAQMATFIARAVDLIHTPTTTPAPTASYNITYTTDAVFDQRDPGGPFVGYEGSVAVWVDDPGSANPRKLPYNYHPGLSPDNKHIYYLSSENGNELWVIDANGSNARKLASSVHVGQSYASYYGLPDWSPDGSRITYEVRDDDEGSGELWVAEVDGSHPRKIADGFTSPSWSNNYDYYWSPDGSRITYRIRSEYSWDELWVVDADGSNARKIDYTAIPLDDANYLGSFGWTRDGSRITYVLWGDAEGSDQVGVAEVDGSHPRSPPISAWRYRWSPDGSRIAYSSFLGGGWVVDADGSDARQFADIYTYIQYSWSPDGSRIAYTVESEDRAELWVVNADGSDARKIADDYLLSSDSWSPDGSRIAYTVESEDWGQLWVINADGSDARRLAGSYSGKLSWSPDGSRIAYTVPSEDRAELWVVNADGSDARKIADSVALVRGWVPASD